MPRSGTAKKNHQHNHRHEHGLVGPGKRITKARSNGQLNGATKPSVADLPSLTPPTTSIDAPVRNHVGSYWDLPLSDTRQDVAESTGYQWRRKRSSTSSADGQNVYANVSLHGRESDEGPSHRYDVGSSKRTSCGGLGTLQLASTILQSCPAYDTIAMLILLLQLPPIFLTLVQALFASLTFMPPSGLSMTSVISLFDVFQGSAGTPSLGTMIAVDALCLGAWFCLWNWARNFALDLAQVQIAITLGGGNAGRPGSVNSVCIFVVLLLHLVRSKSVRQFFFDHTLSSKLLAHDHVTHVAQYIPQQVDFGSTPQSPSWYRSLFAIHIITQAGIAMIRRSVASSRVSSTSKVSKRADTEAFAGAANNQDLSAFEPGLGGNVAGSVDSQTSTPLCLKDGKDGALTAKKRRRKANQVRTRQPFWAALASTKVNALREIEISRPSSHSSVHAVGDASDTASTDMGHICITHVDSSSIKFEAINLQPVIDDHEVGLAHHHGPLFVRINGAYWTSTSISISRTDKPETILTGEVSGLAPNCTYTCSFIRGDGQEIAVIMVKTPMVSDKDQMSSLSSLSSPPFHNSQRPSSPTTTLRQSIATAEAKLSDTKARASRTRRSHKAALAKLEKEVDALSNRLKSSGDDTKQRQKLLQAERTMKQNEGATLSISAALDDLSTIPKEEADDYSSKKDAFEKQRTLLTATNESLASAKASADSELASLNEESKAVNRQRERLLARQTRLNEQHDRITQANLQGLNEKDRRAGETLAKEQDHGRIEAEYQSQCNVLQRELANISMRIQQAKQESQALESQILHQQQPGSMIGGGLLASEGNLPAMNQTARPSPSAFSLGFPSNHPLTAHPAALSAESAHIPPLPPYSKPLAFHSDHSQAFRTNRARSASNRSGGAVSNYSADFEDADPIPPLRGGKRFASDGNGKRRGSGGSPGMGVMASPNSASAVGAVSKGGVGTPSPMRASASANANMSRKDSPGQGIW